MARFAAFLVFTLAATVVRADIDDRFAGRYVGCAVSNGEWSPIETVLSMSDGALSGSYVFIESDGRQVAGRIEPGAPTREAGVALRWHDVYGDGPALFRFAPDGSRFDGYWTTDDRTRRFAWYGVRAEAGRPSPDCRVPVS